MEKVNVVSAAAMLKIFKLALAHSAAAGTNGGIMNPLIGAWKPVVANGVAIGEVRVEYVWPKYRPATQRFPNHYVYYRTSSFERAYPADCTVLLAREAAMALAVVTAFASVPSNA